MVVDLKGLLHERVHALGTERAAEREALPADQEEPAGPADPGVDPVRASKNGVLDQIMGETPAVIEQT